MENLIIIKELLLSFIDSPEKEHIYDTSFFGGISVLLTASIKEIGHVTAQSAVVASWLEFIEAGLYYYNESASVEFVANDISLRFFVHILDNIINNTVEDILPFSAEALRLV